MVDPFRFAPAKSGISDYGVCVWRFVMTSRLLHPAFFVVAKDEKAWSMSDNQANNRAFVVLRALVDAGMIPDAEIFHGMIVKKEPALSGSSPSPYAPRYIVHHISHNWEVGGDKESHVYLKRIALNNTDATR
jgi:hypothetical protein